jgi:hypothetical protein
MGEGHSRVNDCEDTASALLMKFGVRISRHFGHRTRLCDGGPEEFPVEHGDESDADRFRADCFALVLISAGPESFPVHRGDHGFGAFRSLRLALG